jgi:hypothetical protein
MVLKDVNDVIGEYTGLSRKVLEWSLITARTLENAKQPGFSVRSWDSLAELAAVDEFERIGNFKEVMTWQEFVEFMTRWAVSADWACSFKRVTEHGNTVFLELEERGESIVNSVSVYEFNDAGKIRHIDVYLQMALPQLGDIYDGVRMSE